MTRTLLLSLLLSLPALAQTQLKLGSLAPRDGLYRVRLKLDAPPPAGDAAVAPGTAFVDATPRSPLRDWTTALVALLVRESGF